MREAEETVAQDGLFVEAAGGEVAPSTPTRTESLSAHPSTAGDATTPPLAASQPAASSDSTTKPASASKSATALADDADIQAAMAAEQAAATQLDDFEDHYADEEAIAAEMDMGGWGEDF